MHQTWLAQNGRHLACLILAAAALMNGGCLAVAAAAGAGAASYAYVKGKVAYSFNANLEDTWNATRKSLTELGMPILGEERENADSGLIKTEASDGTPVRIFLEVERSAFPADGSVTSIFVRVGTFGDYPISDRILRQVSAHLVPASAPGNPPPWSAATPPVPPTTAPPPLLPPVPVKK